MEASVGPGLLKPSEARRKSVATISVPIAAHSMTTAIVSLLE